MPQKKRKDTLLGVLAIVLAAISLLCFFAAYRLRAQTEQNLNDPPRMLVGQFSSESPKQNDALMPKPVCRNDP